MEENREKVRASSLARQRLSKLRWAKMMERRARGWAGAFLRLRRSRRRRAVRRAEPDRGGWRLGADGALSDAVWIRVHLPSSGSLGHRLSRPARQQLCVQRPAAACERGDGVHSSYHAVGRACLLARTPFLLFLCAEVSLEKRWSTVRWNRTCEAVRHPR